jgi:magnesium chelatase family protein
VRAYLSRLSGPLLDRIDLRVEMGRVAAADLLAAPPEVRRESPAVRERVVAARAIAAHRLAREPGAFANADLTPRTVRRYCAVRGGVRRLLESAALKLGLTARAIDRVLKVSRTIADLDSAPEIGEPHLAEALQYRGLGQAWAQLEP